MRGPSCHTGDGGGGSVCTEVDSGADCLIPDDGCGSPKETKICAPNNLSRIFYENLCGEIADAFIPCGGLSLCDDSGSEVKCVGDTPCGSNKAQKVCDPSEPSKVFWADECGNLKGFVPCGSGFVCDDTGDEAQCQEKNDGGGPVKGSTSCVEADPTKVF
ncbi:MAG: hypothetical protein ACI9OJ_005687 [Myxococcota bacterium]|jgi:hypothetical protein